MKKVISAIIASAVALSSMMPVMAEKDVVSVIINNETVEFDQPPIIDDGTTLVPVRAVFEKAGAVVEWDQETQTATLTKDPYTVTITLNDTVLYKNGEAVELAKPAQIVSDRVLIPVRAIGEAMDFDVNWDGYHSQVVISTDGTEYRPYVVRSVGFREIKEAAQYYSEESFSWQELDVDNDGVLDTVSFTSTLDTASEETPLLLINGNDFTPQLSFMSGIYSFALIDLDKDDKTKEIIITESGDNLTAYLFRYVGDTLVPLMNQAVRAKIKYASKLFFDNEQYFISDLDGFTWTDIMYTESVYCYKDGDIVQYYAKNASNMMPRKLVHTYDDDMIYKVYRTDTFNGGSYINSETNETISASELTEFTLNETYTDNLHPENIELFITLSDGTNMVLVPYSS